MAKQNALLRLRTQAFAIQKARQRQMDKSAQSKNKQGLHWAFQSRAAFG